MHQFVTRHRNYFLFGSHNHTHSMSVAISIKSRLIIIIGVRPVLRSIESTILYSALQAL